MFKFSLLLSVSQSNTRSRIYFHRYLSKQSTNTNNPANDPHQTPQFAGRSPPSLIILKSTSISVLTNRGYFTSYICFPLSLTKSLMAKTWLSSTPFIRASNPAYRKRSRAHKSSIESSMFSSFTNATSRRACQTHWLGSNCGERD